MKKICKIMLIAFFIMNLYLNVYTINASDAKIDIWNTGANFLNTGSDRTEGGSNPLSWLWGKLDNAETNPKKDFEQLIDFLWGIGLLVVFGSTIVLGIKYMLVNPGEKSKLKQVTTPYIIGVIIIFGALTIWKLVIAIIEDSIM